MHRGLRARALAKKPPTHHIPAPRVAGINVDASTIPQLQALMNRHRLKSVPAHPVLPASDQEAQPAAQRGDHRQPDGARRRPRRRQGAQARLASPAARDPGARSRTTSTRPACRRPPARGRSPAAARATRSSSSSCAPPAPMIIGKANLSEWANFRSAPSSSGWSGIGGQTNMAYVLDRNPCGSSSGSGVGGLRRPRDDHRRHRDRRVDRVPVGRKRRRRDQADPRAPQPVRHRADLGRPGHRRPDHAQRDRRGGRCWAP